MKKIRFLSVMLAAMLLVLAVPAVPGVTVTAQAA